MNKIGTCMYCGQERMVEAEENETFEAICVKASMECTCDGAEKAREEREKIEWANRDISVLFDSDTAAGKLLLASVENVFRGEIKSIQIDVGDGVKGKISLTTDGKIKVERTETNKFVRTSNA